MKLAVLGGGGVRAPFLVKTLITNAYELDIDLVYLMDIDEDKLSKYGVLAKAVGEKIDDRIEIRLTTDEVEALTDADYVITTIRVGGDDGRYFDEKLAQKYGVLGQETTGVGGFAMSLRSIPTLIRYMELIEKIASPNCKTFNFTNPSGLVTQALKNKGFKNVYGICDGPNHFTKQLAALMGVKRERFDVTCYGLNHLSFYRNFKIDGKDCKDELLHHEDLFNDTEMSVFNKNVVNILDEELPNEYLYFFFNNSRVVDNISKNGMARGELIRDINRRMKDALNKEEGSSLEEKFGIWIKYLFERENSYFSIESNGKHVSGKVECSLQEFIDAPDEGGYAGIALNIIKGTQGKDALPMTILVKNEGSIPGLKDEDVVEITCDFNNGNIKPRKIEDIPLVQNRYIQSIKDFERLVIQAIEKKDKKLAIKALLVHPLINDEDIAENIVEEILEEYKQYIGEWK